MMIAITAVCLLAITIIGCTPEELAKVDSVAEAAGDVSAAGQGVLVSPVGVFIPEPYRTVGELILGGLSVLSAYWLNKRKNEYKTGLIEMDYAEKIFKETDLTGNKELDVAKAAALNPPTVKLIKKVT